MFHQYFDPLDYLEQVLQLQIKVCGEHILVSGLDCLSPYMRLWARHIVERYKRVIKVQVDNDRTPVSTLIIQGKVSCRQDELSDFLGPKR
ncbi:MAG: hypothetical protein ACQEUB_08320 [Thermodesulfobacteriota bacterium]